MDSLICAPIVEPLLCADCYPPTVKTIFFFFLYGRRNGPASLQPPLPRSTGRSCPRDGYLTYFIELPRLRSLPRGKTRCLQQDRFVTNHRWRRASHSCKRLETILLTRQYGDRNTGESSRTTTHVRVFSCNSDRNHTPSRKSPEERNPAT